MVLEALNDYLLALRFLLEGGGPADLGLSMRVAALCAEPDDGGATKSVVDRGIALERELWSGEPAATTGDALTPSETAATVEELARAILRDAACGHLGSDLRSTADEILLADGLAVGEGRAEHRGGAEEWESGVDELEPEEPPDGGEEFDAPEESAYEEPAAEEPEHPEDSDQKPDQVAGPAPAQHVLWSDEEFFDTREIPRAEEPAMQVPEPEGRIRVESLPDPEEENVFESPKPRDEEPETRVAGAINGHRVHGRVAELLDARREHQERTADRVRHLFPRPETTEWDVRELSYDRQRRARVNSP